MGTTEETAETYGAVVWTGLALVVGLWWSLAQLDLVPFSWRMTTPLVVVALAISLYLSVRSA